LSCVENTKNINDAKIFMGSKEETRDNLVDIKSPYSKDIVSRYPKCSEDDAKRALEIAKRASIDIAKSPLHQGLPLCRKDVGQIS